MVSNAVTPSIAAFWVWGVAELERNIGWRGIGLQDLTSNMAIPAFYEPLIDRKKIVFPPLHIKLGLMKKFVKALKTEGGCFMYPILAFPDQSIEKSRLVCLMVHRFGSSLKMIILSGQCQNLKRMLGHHSKTLLKIFASCRVSTESYGPPDKSYWTYGTYKYRL